MIPSRTTPETALRTKIDWSASGVTLPDPGSRQMLLVGSKVFILNQTGTTSYYWDSAADSTFGNDAWAAHAPGLKTLDDALERERDELRQRVAKTNADEPLLVVETASSETKNLNKHPGGDTQFGRFVAAAIEQTILV